MNLSISLGPFENYRDRLPIPGKGNPIDPHVIDLILREIDCVEYSDSFLKFIEYYIEEISSRCDVLVWIISSSVTNLSRKRPGYKIIVERLIECCNYNISSSSIKEIDIDSVFYFIGLLIETNNSPVFAISALTTSLLSCKFPEEVSDALHVISNHRMTLEKVYGLPDMDGVKYSLDDAIQALS